MNIRSTSGLDIAAGRRETCFSKFADTISSLNEFTTVKPDAKPKYHMITLE